VVRQWARDRCPQQAASLAYQSSLSIVPLIAIGLALLRAIGAAQAESALVEILSRQVIPVSRKEIADHLLEWSRNLSRTAGVAGVAFAVVLSFILYHSVERIFNDIWRVERRRSLGQKFVVFYALVTLTPALMGFSLYHAARYGLTTGVWGAAGALAATWAALFFANKLLPATRVHWKAAAVGALLSALAFEAAKHLFQLYLARVAFEKYADIYGTIGLVPIVLVWIYYTWLVILLGAEVAHAAQHLSHLERLDRRRLSPENELFEKTNGVVAARLMCAIVEGWRRGEGGLTRSALAARFDLSEEVVERVFRRLKGAGLILEVEGDAEGYLPARAPTEITLADVMAPFRGSDLVTAGRSAARSRLDTVLADIEAAVRDRSRAVTVDELTAKKS
jgi:membrane protein